MERSTQHTSLKHSCSMGTTGSSLLLDWEGLKDFPRWTEMPTTEIVLKEWDFSQLLGTGIALSPERSAGVRYLTLVEPANGLCFPNSFSEVRNMLSSCLNTLNMGNSAQHGTQRMGFIPSLQGREKFSSWIPLGPKPRLKLWLVNQPKTSTWSTSKGKAEFDRHYPWSVAEELQFLCPLVLREQARLSAQLWRDKGTKEPEHASWQCSSYRECKKTPASRAGRESPSLSLPVMGVLLRHLSAFCLGTRL